METLLRPAKQLAEWDSTFAQDLNTYFDLLKKSQSVNFGEAALVLQNSANVYARRVEYLRDETEALNQSLVINSAEKNGEEQIAREKKGSKSKSVIDFDDFESLSLDDFVGKSNNLKKGEQKNLKLLTRRFTQLESNLAQLSSPIEILSAQGEVIGNKYDFRCNQQLTKNCMLVDELTPNDFSAAQTTAISDIGTPTLTISPRNQDSGFDSTFDSNVTAASPCNPLFKIMETNAQTSENENVEKSDDIPDDNDAGYTSGDAGEDNSESPASRITNRRQESPNTETGAVELETNPPQAVTSPRTEAPVPPSNSPNEEELEPIPFEQGVPNTIPKRRAVFKLPCHLSLLKQKSGTRKRKKATENKTQHYLTKLLLDNYNLANKKLKMYSPTRQLFSPSKIDDLEEWQRICDQYLKSMQDSDSYHYDAITQGVATELLGFRSNFTKHDSAMENHLFVAEDSIADSSMIVEPESDLASVPESFTTPPPTPEAANHRSSYRELVEQRVKQIGEESREQSDLEQRVAKWHKFLRPKLAAAGRRPPFDIHEYGSTIIQTLEAAENQKVPFVDIVRQESAPEVARYFLASLQLANSYNVAINTTVGDPECGIELELLEKEVRQKSLALHEKIDRIRSLSKT